MWLLPALILSLVHDSWEQIDADKDSMWAAFLKRRSMYIKNTRTRVRVYQGGVWVEEGEGRGR